MRIFYASDTTPNAFFESNLWKKNLFYPLLDLGHDVVEFQYDLKRTFQNLDPADPFQKRFIKKNRPKVIKALLHQIKKAHAEKPVDIFFSYFYDACILPETLAEIKSLGIKTVNWYCNGSYQLHLVSQISPHYDYCLVPEKFRLDDYKKIGATPIYCQEAANPNFYKPYNLKKDFDVTFIGQAYGERPDYIKFLHDNKININVFGSGWDFFTTKKPENRRGTTSHQGTTSREGTTSHQGLKLLKKILISPFVLSDFFSKNRTEGTTLHQGFELLKKLFSKDGTYLLQKKLFYLLHRNKTKKLHREQYISPARLPQKIVGGILSDTEMIKLYSRSKINLGFSTCGNTHSDGKKITQIRLRDFEVPMCGGFYLVEYMPELEEFFEIGKEIECYRDKEDLVDKIKFYLKHDATREKIARAGKNRCLRDHTWQKRYKMVFETVD